MEHFRKLYWHCSLRQCPATVTEVWISPVSMLSLTKHSPASRATSQGRTRPSRGMIRQSPGTRSTELTCSSEETHPYVCPELLGLQLQKAVHFFFFTCFTNSKHRKNYSAPFNTKTHPSTVSVLWHSWHSGPFCEEWCFAIKQQIKKDL